MAHKYAHFRGQRFKVVNENEKYVTLEGFGYSKKHLKDEVIFEEKPEDTLVSGIDDNSELHPPRPNVVDLPNARKDNEIVLSVKEDRDDAHDMEDDLVDQDPNFKRISPAEKHEIQKAETQRLTVPKDIKDRPRMRHQDLSATFEEEVVVPAAPQPTSTATEAPHGTKDFPNYPDIGIDTSIFTADDRHKENERRRKDALSLFKEKLSGLLKELDTVNEAPIEGKDMPYETFEQFFQDFIDYAKDNDLVSPDKEIDVDHTVVGLTTNKYCNEFIKSLGGVNNAVSILSKKVSEMGMIPAELAMAEHSEVPPVTAPPGAAMPADDDDARLQSKLGGPISPSLTEDSAASGMQGGPVASGPAAGPGTTTSAVANYDAPIGIGTRKRPLNEENPTK